MGVIKVAIFTMTIINCTVGYVFCFCYVPFFFSILAVCYFAVTIISLFSGEQFSVVLSLSQSDCKDGTINSLDAINFETVIQTMARGEIYKDGRITAAIPHRLTSPKGNLITKHAEERVLKDINTNTKKDFECLILYTLNSPCTKYCLSTNNHVSIVPTVTALFQNVKEGYKAFVFDKIYYDDIENKSKDEVHNFMKKITGPKLYCCYEDRKGEMKCYEYLMNTSEQHCLSEFDQKKN